MKGYEIPLLQFVGTPTMQFIIPVYQRNYNWSTHNCERLIGDLEKIISENKATHFFGSTVSSPTSDGYSRIVIDGQQRLTTISLLLLAAIKCVENGEMTVTNNNSLREAHYMFLDANFCSSERKIKLVPIIDDRIAYDAIYNNEELVTDSNMTRNYKFFIERLKNSTLTFDQLLDAIKKLQIITIELSKDDDAQLIFECINSTGLALSEADKARNFLLMNLDEKTQEEYFRDYWNKIERFTEKDPTELLLHFLSINTSNKVTKSALYELFKSYCQKFDRKGILEELLKYAEVYHDIRTAKGTTPGISMRLENIAILDSTQHIPFFIPFFIYAKENSMPYAEIEDVLDTIINFWARRIVCDLPSSALYKLFLTLHNETLRVMEQAPEVDKTYSDALKYVLLRKRGTSAFPTDTAVSEILPSRQIYTLVSQNKKFLFTMLEYGTSKERASSNIIESWGKTISVEHIMPQKLSASWKEMLGNDADRIHEKYLHTLANLTLTAYNSELGNRSFQEKYNGFQDKDGTMVEGYKDSRFALTQGIKGLTKWTEVELKNRGNEMKERFLSIFPMISTSVVLNRQEEDVTLDEAGEMTYRDLFGFTFLGDTRYDTSNWSQLLSDVCHIIYEQDPRVLDSLCLDNDNRKGKLCIWFGTTPDFNTMNKSMFAPDRYVITNKSNNEKIKFLKDILNACNIDHSELILHLKPQSN